MRPPRCARRRSDSSPRMSPDAAASSGGPRSSWSGIRPGRLFVRTMALGRRHTDMRPHRTHALLPWYANGTLEPYEKEEFERHLETCPSCRDEFETIGAMRVEIARHGEAFFGDHPAPEVLGALFGMGEGPIGPAEEETVRRHLAVCATCSEESQWLTGAEIAGGVGARAGSWVGPRAGVPSASAPGWWTRSRVARLWPAAAAAALALLATVIVPGPWRGGFPRDGHPSPVGPVARGFLEPTARSTGIAEVLVRREHAAVVLDLRSELTPSQLPARIEILDDL